VVPERRKLRARGGTFKRMPCTRLGNRIKNEGFLILRPKENEKQCVGRGGKEQKLNLAPPAKTKSQAKSEDGGARVINQSLGKCTQKGGGNQERGHRETWGMGIPVRQRAKHRKRSERHSPRSKNKARRRSHGRKRRQ